MISGVGRTHWMGWRPMQEIGVIFLPLPALRHLALLPALHRPALSLKEQILVEVARVS